MKKGSRKKVTLIYDHDISFGSSSIIAQREAGNIVPIERPADKYNRRYSSLCILVIQSRINYTSYTSEYFVIPTVFYSKS